MSQQQPYIVEKEKRKEEPKILDLYNKTIKEDICPTLTEPHHNNLRVLLPKNCSKIVQTNKDAIWQEDRIYSDEGITPTLSCVMSGKININQKTRDVEKALNVAQNIADKEQKPVQVDLMHLQHGEIRPLSSYIPQDLDVHRCLQAGEPKEVLVEPAIYGSGQNHKGIRKPMKTKGVSPTLMAGMGEGGGNVPVISPCLQGFGGGQRGKLGLWARTGLIRKLTPKECFRLMGFLDDGINLDGLSDTQRYKLAGNGWDINLVSKIFKRMFKDE